MSTFTFGQYFERAPPSIVQLAWSVRIHRGVLYRRALERLPVGVGFGFSARGGPHHNIRVGEQEILIIDTPFGVSPFLVLGLELFLSRDCVGPRLVQGSGQLSNMFISCCILRLWAHAELGVDG